jgi:D-tyrosyl-tRNA(Tyr) deacylase
VRLVLQRVNRASVRVDDETVGAIAHGLLILIGVREGDDEAQASRLASKVAELPSLPAIRATSIAR